VTQEASQLAAEVARAIAELEAEFGEVTAEPTGDGGARVTVHDVELGDRWAPKRTAVHFVLAYNYPDAAIYPYFVTNDLQRIDNGPWPGALQRGIDTFGTGPRVQVSLRASRWRPHVDTAVGAIQQVRRWFQEIA
jgi:hypothetical protein